MIKILDGGDLQKKGYYYAVCINHPDIMLNAKVTSLRGDVTKSTEINFPNSFYLTRSNTHVIIGFSILGFGLQFSIISFDEEK